MHLKFIFGIVIILLAAGIFIWQDLKERKNDVSQEITDLPTPAPAPSIDSGQAPPSAAKPIPTLPFPVETDNPEALNKIQELTLRLRENPELQTHWIELGLWRKFIGDFEGAREAWEYAAFLRPEDFIPHNNLGDLWAYSLNEPKKAEESFLKAIELEPAAVVLYQKLYEVYRFLLKDDKKAREILLRGIETNPSTSERLSELLVDSTGSPP